MQVVSDAFKAEIVKSHTVYSYVDVTSPTGQTFRLTATGGSVDIDRTADVRRKCSLDVVDPNGNLTPKNASSVLTPYGTEIRPYRGVKYTAGVLAGSYEVVPLGVFRLSEATVHDQVGGSPSINISGYDLSRTVARAKFEDVYTVATGTNLVTAIQTIVQLSLPDTQFDTTATTMTATSPIVFDADSDPWAACQTIAASAAMEVYFTASGRCKVAPPVDIDHLPAPQWRYVEGDHCTMLDLEVKFSDDPGYNGVIVVGQAADGTTPAVRSVLWDTEPSSPTYYKGPYGKVPFFVSDSNITTQEQADAAAAATLNQILGFSSQLNVSAIVNPALDANDVIEVVRERSGVSGKFALDAISMPLAAGSSSGLNLRQKRTV
jgi:hypothetical protein